MNNPASTDQPSSAAAQHAFARFAPRIGMVSFRVTDIARSLRFYVDTLGMVERIRVPGLTPDEHELVLEYPGTPGAAVMLMWNSKRTERYPLGDAYNRLTIVVDDVKTALKQLHDLGTKVLMPVTAANGVLFAVITDPDGLMIELLQLDVP